MQAGSPDFVVLNDGHVEAGTRAAQGRGVAAGSSSDDDYVVGCVTHTASLIVR